MVCNIFQTCFCSEVFYIINAQFFIVVTDPEKMCADGSEADSLRDCTLEVGAPLIGGGEDGDHQHEGADELHAEGLAHCHCRVDVANTHSEAIGGRGDDLRDTQ